MELKLLFSQFFPSLKEILGIISLHKEIGARKLQSPQYKSAYSKTFWSETIEQKHTLLVVGGAITPIGSIWLLWKFIMQLAHHGSKFLAILFILGAFALLWYFRSSQNARLENMRLANQAGYTAEMTARGATVEYLKKHPDQLEYAFTRLLDPEPVKIKKPRRDPFAVDPEPATDPSNDPGANPDPAAQQPQQQNPQQNPPQPNPQAQQQTPQQQSAPPPQPGSTQGQPQPQPQPQRRRRNF